MGDEYTIIKLGDGDVAYVCDNCGATSLQGREQIEHHASCRKGEAKYWEWFYSQDE